MSAMASKLTVLVTHPIQYYVPLYKQLSQKGNVPVHVIYLTCSGAKPYYDGGFGRIISWDIPMLEGYDYSVLADGYDIGKAGFFGRYSSSLLSALNSVNSDHLLIYGYGSLMNWMALLWAKINGVTVLYLSDSNYKISTGVFRRKIKKIVLKLFFRCVDVFLSVSESNRHYLLYYGAEDDKITRIPFSIDVDRYMRSSLEQGFIRKYDFIWVGKFVSLKRPADVIEALHLVAHRMDGERTVRLCFVGDGALYQDIQAKAAQLPGNIIVDFLGFISQKELPPILSNADVLLFTSEKEAYGLIAAEAASCGVAIIAQESIGCVGSTDVARNGVNAFIYKAGDIKGLADSMVSTLSDRLVLYDMQRESLSIANEQRVEVAVGIIERLIHGVRP